MVSAKFTASSKGLEMTLKFVDKTIKIALTISIAVFLGLWIENHFSLGLGFFLGDLWGCINLLLINQLLRGFLLKTSSNHWKNYILLGLKFPMLYFIGYLLLKIDLAAQALLAGFILLLATALSIGFLTLRKNKPRPTSSAGQPLVDRYHGK